VYARRVEGRELTFDFAEGLLKDNLLVVDRETGSIWSQLEGKAISGPMKNMPLQVVPSLQTTWKHWRQRHPSTRVVVVEGEKGRPYLYRNRRPGTPAHGPRPTVHDVAALGLGLVVGDKPMYFPFSELDQVETPLRVDLGGQAVVVHYLEEALTAWGEDEEGRMRVGVLAYEFGWLDFHPESEVFRAPREP